MRRGEVLVRVHMPGGLNWAGVYQLTCVDCGRTRPGWEVMCWRTARGDDAMIICQACGQAQHHALIYPEFVIALDGPYSEQDLSEQEVGPDGPTVVRKSEVLDQWRPHRRMEGPTEELDASDDSAVYWVGWDSTSPENDGSWWRESWPDLVAVNEAFKIERQNNPNSPQLEAAARVRARLAAGAVVRNIAQETFRERCTMYARELDRELRRLGLE